MSSKGSKLRGRRKLPKRKLIPTTNRSALKQGRNATYLNHDYLNGHTKVNDILKETKT